MKLEPIIEALRQRCSLLGDRVAGAAQFKTLPETSAMAVPYAFVIPLDDAPGAQQSQNAVRQELQDSFAVVVALSNAADEKGQVSANAYDIMRAHLFAALLGWEPQEGYEAIVYEGGSILQLDRARMWCQFEFSSTTLISDADGWRWTELNGLPHFDGLNVQVDAIEPFDPNRGATGPDGRNETGGAWPRTGNLA